MVSGCVRPGLYGFCEYEKVKPIFLKDEDVFGSSMKPARSLWLTNVEIYKAIGVRVPSQCIKGIQRIRDMWRIYVDHYGIQKPNIYQFEAFLGLGFLMFYL
jgi:hypothetical protein